MKRVLVTGGSGFLGSHIADTLTIAGYAVTIFDHISSPYLQPGQEFVLGDILDRNSVEAAVPGNDYVFHLAGLADLEIARTAPLATTRLNVIGTLHLLEAARKVGVQRFVFASTVSVYSQDGGFYRCSKQACEGYIEEYQRQYDLPYTILRYGGLYGPRSRMLQDVRTPDDSREHIHVEDAARLSVQALDERYRNRHLVLSGNHAICVESRR